MKISSVITGGEKLEATLRKLSEKVNKAALLRVGFLEGSTEAKDGLSTPLLAFWNEFGGRYTLGERDVTTYKSISANGEYNKNGRFVKKKNANFAETFHVGPSEVYVPPRPFFRRMIRLGRDHWGRDLAKILKGVDYDAETGMNLLGQQMIGELQTSIRANVYAPLKPATISRKGNDQQLIDSGDMWNAVNCEVSE